MLRKAEGQDFHARNKKSRRNPQSVVGARGKHETVGEKRQRALGREDIERYRFDCKKGDFGILLTLGHAEGGGVRAVGNQRGEGQKGADGERDQKGDRKNQIETGADPKGTRAKIEGNRGLGGTELAEG